jgi:hypothetical protein
MNKLLIVILNAAVGCLIAGTPGALVGVVVGCLVCLLIRK